MANATESTSRLFQAVREAQDEQLRLADQHEHARARARLLQVVDQAAARVSDGAASDQVATVARPGRRLGAGWRWGLGGLAAAGCAFAVLFAIPGQREAELERPASLEFLLDGDELAADQVIVSGEQPRLVAVSDSTRIELAPRGRMYVDAVRPNGATVVLERGEISLAVHHEDDTSWQVAAGPWTVHVTGTQFVVAWEPSSEEFRVAVTEGSVRVEGPEDEFARLGPGDELVRARGKATIEPETLEDSEPSTPTELDPFAQPDEIVEDNGERQAIEQVSAGSVGSTAGTSKAAVAAPRWDEFFVDSDYEAAWDALADRPGGIHGEAERAADAKTMLDLADVARFTKHGSDTRKVLERLRARFPASNEAGEAAFALGRLAADGGSQAKAAVWFERYLDERPNGSFVGDALGRLMDCYEDLGEAEQAKSAATRYLARHPEGPHAAKAEKILAR